MVSGWCNGARVGGVWEERGQPKVRSSPWSCFVPTPSPPQHRDAEDLRSQGVGRLEGRAHCTLQYPGLSPIKVRGKRPSDCDVLQARYAWPIRAMVSELPQRFWRFLCFFFSADSSRYIESWAPPDPSAAFTSLLLPPNLALPYPPSPLRALILKKTLDPLVPSTPFFSFCSLLLP